MAHSPAGTDTSSDLYAPSEPTEEQDHSCTIDHERPHGSGASLSQEMESPDNQMPVPRTASAGSTQNVDHRHGGDDPFRSQANAHPKRKREEEPETPYSTSVESGNTELHARREYNAGIHQPNQLDDDKSFSEPKRIRINGHPPENTSPAKFQDRSVTLPAELWHHIFRFVPPVFLGRLLRVNHAFNSYLTSDTPEPDQMDNSFGKGVRPLDAETIWAASRKLYARSLPKPLRGLKELDMWRLLLGKACQLCGQAKDLAPMVGEANFWESGPGERTDIDLLLSSDFPSFLRLALPFALVSKSMNYIPKALSREPTLPPSLDLVKRFYKPHLQQIQRRLVDVQELGTASAEEWGKGLGEEGLERTNDAQRWEQWEAKGGLKRCNKRAPTKVLAPLAITAAVPNLPPKPPNVLDVDMSAPQHVPGNPSHNGQHSDEFTLPTDQYQYHYGSTTYGPTSAYQPSWVNPIQLQELPTQHSSPSIPLPRPERNIKTANEAKAARRAEIERRCSLLDPPLPANILKHMDSFQAAIQISTPFTDFAWDTLKPRLLAQRASAEKKEQALVQQNELLQSERRQRSHQEIPPKDTRDAADRRWDRTQAPVQDLLGALADAYIDERWHGGRTVNKENSPKFAADVLLTVRQRFYERFALADAAAQISGQPIRSGTTNGPHHPTLFLESMKWVFDTKIKPFTEHFQRELFLCNGCDDNFKFYGFEGVIQHYAAKHTNSLSQGSIVVYWRAEWPDEPPFNPEPSLSKSAYYKVPSPTNAAPSSYSQINQQLFGPNDRHVAAAAMESQQPTDGYSTYHNTIVPHNTQAIPYQDTTNQYSHNVGYNTPSSSATVHGVQNTFVQAQPVSHVQDWQGNSTSVAPWQGGGTHSSSPQYNGYNYPASFNTQETAAVSSYESHGSFRAAAPHPLHFDPSRNNVAQLTESYQQQMEEMAKQARDVWFGTQGIKDLPASVRIYVVIHHMASRCSAKFTVVPSLAMFLDGIDNNAQMRPVRSLNGLACKICVTHHNATYATDPHSQPPAGDRKLFTLPHLLNHFRNAHLEGSEAFANPGSGPASPKHDWTRHMIELPEDRLISNLVYSPGMDDNKLDLVASAFPQIFPLPLPSLGFLRSSGVLRNAGAGSEIKGGPGLKYEYPLGHTDHSSIVPTYTKSRVDDLVYDRPTSTFRPASELSRPSEPPGEDEYDPHKPAYQGKPNTTGAVPGRNHAVGVDSHPLGEKPGWQVGYYDRPISQTTDLSKLLYGTAQMQPGHEETRQPQRLSNHAHNSAGSPEYSNPEKAATRAVVSTYQTNGDRIAANSSDHTNGLRQVTDLYAPEQREVGNLRHLARSPSTSAGLRAAEHFFKHFNQAPGSGKAYDSSSLEQRQRSVPLEQWPGESKIRFAEGERRYQNEPPIPMSYGSAPVRSEVSPTTQIHQSSPTLQGDRDTNLPHYQASGMHQQTNHQRVTSNSLVKIEDPELHRPGTRAYVEHTQARGSLIQDRHRYNGYGIERPQSKIDEYRHTQDSYFQDQARYSVPITPAPVYYRSRSPVEDSQSQPVYRVRSPSPVPRQVQRIPYGHSYQDRYELVGERDYPHDPKTHFQRHVEYVPVHMDEQRYSNSSRYMVAQHRDHDPRANYVRVDDTYDQGTLYERDGQLYRADPPTYRTPTIRNDGIASGYSY
ncbi:MAG: hypothetical protein Q9204_001903 [Flavoplaca sp. TL-2023a]